MNFEEELAEVRAERETIALQLQVRKAAHTEAVAAEEVAAGEAGAAMPPTQYSAVGES